MGSFAAAEVCGEIVEAQVGMYIIVVKAEVCSFTLRIQTPS